MPLTTTFAGASARSFGYLGGSRNYWVLSASLSTFRPRDIDATLAGNIVAADDNSIFSSFSTDGINLVNADLSSTTKYDSIKIDSNGDYVFLADTTSTSGHVVKYNAAGSILWQRSITGQTAFNSSLRNGLACDSSNNIYTVDGFGQVFKFNSSGTLLWQISPNSNFISGAGKTLASNTSGEIALIVSGTNGAGSFGPGLCRINTSGTITSFTYLFLSSYQLGASAIDNSGNSYIAYADASSTTLAKFDSSGGILWQRSINTTLLVGQLSKIHIDADLNVYLFNDAYILKYNSSGTLLWQRQFSGLFDPINLTTDGDAIILTMATSTYTGIMRLPNDGSLTGTIAVPGGFTTTYSASTFTSSTTTSSWTLLSNPGTQNGLATVGASSLTTSTPSITYTKQAL